MAGENQKKENVNKMHPNVKRETTASRRGRTEVHDGGTTTKDKHKEHTHFFDYSSWSPPRTLNGSVLEFSCFRTLSSLIARTCWTKRLHGMSCHHFLPSLFLHHLTLQLVLFSQMQFRIPDFVYVPLVILCVEMMLATRGHARSFPPSLTHASSFFSSYSFLVLCALIWYRGLVSRKEIPSRKNTCGKCARFFVELSLALLLSFRNLFISFPHFSSIIISQD